MKLLAHLIYLLNEQGVGNTFYLSPIIKKILDNHLQRNIQGSSMNPKNNMN